MKVEQVLDVLNVNQSKLGEMVGVSRARVARHKKTTRPIPERWQWRLNKLYPDLFPSPTVSVN